MHPVFVRDQPHHLTVSLHLSSFQVVQSYANVSISLLFWLSWRGIRSRRCILHGDVAGGRVENQALAGRSIALGNCVHEGPLVLLLCVRGADQESIVRPPLDKVFFVGELQQIEAACNVEVALF